MKQDWRKQLQHKMDGYKQHAPELSWAEIEQATHRQHDRRIVLNRRRYSALAAACLTLLLAIGYFSSSRMERSVNEVQADATRTETQTEKAVQDEQTDEQQAPHTPGHSANGIPMAKAPSLAAANVPLTSEAFTTQMEEEHLEAPEPTKVPEQNTALTETDKNNNESIMARKANKAHNNDRQAQQAGRSHNLTSNSRVAFSAYFGGMAGASNLGNSNMALAYASAYGDENIANKYEMHPQMDYVVSTDVNHHQPIRMGLSVSYQFSKRWSVDAGFSYSRQTSDIDTYTMSSWSHSEQKLTYIGIPIHANYNLWRSKWLNVYMAAGGAIEKMVKGKIKALVTVNGNAGEPTCKNVSIRPLQFSMNAAIGAELKIQKHVSLYAEPGVSHYFENGSKVPTYYKDKPTNFSLNMGLRFNLK